MIPRQVLARTALALPAKWMVAASLATISFCVGGIGAVAIGVFLGPMMADLGWPNGLTSSLATAFNLAYLLAAPAVGLCLARVGARIVVTLGVIATSGGFLLASAAVTHEAMLAAFALVGTGYVASFNVPAAVVIANWMPDRKNAGMSVVWSAMSLGAGLFSGLMAWWVERHGWRNTSTLCAALTALMIPIALTVRTGPSGRTSERARAVDNRSGSNERLPLFSTVFVLATSCGALFAFGMSGIYFHVVAMLIKAGYSTQLAGLVFGASWLLSGIGALGCGGIAGRVGAQRTLAWCLLVCALGTLGLLGAAEARIGAICVAAFVLLWGASANCVNQFIPVILAERLGIRGLGTLVGVQLSVSGITGAAAPMVTGFLYDEFGDYRIAVSVSALAILLAFVLASMIDQRPACLDAREETC